MSTKRQRRLSSPISSFLSVLLQQPLFLSVGKVMDSPLMNKGVATKLLSFIDVVQAIARDHEALEWLNRLADDTNGVSFVRH